MITEIAQIEVLPNTESQFEAAVAQAVPLFTAAPGNLSFNLLRSIEHPHRYRAVIGWATLEDHTILFRQSPAYAQWRTLVSPFFAAPPQVEHQQTITL